MPCSCWGVPACPFLAFQPQTDTQQPFCPVHLLRDAVFSPGSSELEAFLFLLDMMCANSEHCKSHCSLYASPNRTDAQAEPGSLGSAPSITSQWPLPDTHCDITVTASQWVWAQALKQEGGSPSRQPQTENPVLPCSREEAWPPSTCWHCSSWQMLKCCCPFGPTLALLI